MINILTVDVEDYFHPTEVQNCLSPDLWDAQPALVCEETRQVLELFDRHGVKATFFVLGWVAERNPALLREIVAAGHEIGCHSYAHQLVYLISQDEFRADTERAVAVIQDACGVTPRIYRAPSYSITTRSTWALEILVECGFTHDSSIYPIAHDRYGIPGFRREAQVIDTPSGGILEIPIATVRLGKRGMLAPVGGGGYLRLLPYLYTAAGIRKLNREGRSACIYFHPWELDPTQPRLISKLIPRLRTYTGLHSMGSKIERLLADFAFDTLTAVYPSSISTNHAERPYARLELCSIDSELEAGW